MKKLFKIKELKIDENDDITGTHAVSFVDSPAIERRFEYFKNDYHEFFKFTAAPDPEVIETSHKFCREHAGKVYHISEIQKWDRYKNEDGFIKESNFFKDFNGKGHQGFNGDSQLYNCRHSLIRINGPSEIPSKWKDNFEANRIYLKIENEEKRIVTGPILISNKMIYRKDVDGEGNEGYVFFSKDTIRKMQKKYGLNKRISLQHEEDMTGHAIMIKSFLKEEDDKLIWYGSYQIISDELWNYVKTQKVIGFSIEALFNL